MSATTSSLMDLFAIIILALPFCEKKANNFGFKNNL